MRISFVSVVVGSICGPVAAKRASRFNATLTQIDDVCLSLGSGRLLGKPFEPIVDGEVYQFGVASGRSLEVLLAKFKRRTWAFDTFTGMPLSEAGEVTMSVWKEHNFAPHEADLRRRSGAGDVNFIKGTYKDSLTASLATERGMRTATYLDIDVRYTHLERFILILPSCPGA